MKKFILALFLLSPFAANAIDPQLEPEWTFVCDKPIERMDGTPLPVNEIANIQLKRNDGNGFVIVDTQTECSFIIDNTALPDNTYLYVFIATDTEGRTSDDSVPLTHAIQRIAVPKSPTLRSAGPSGG